MIFSKLLKGGEGSGRHRVDMTNLGYAHGLINSPIEHKDDPAYIHGHTLGRTDGGFQRTHAFNSAGDAPRVYVEKGGVGSGRHSGEFTSLGTAHGGKVMSANHVNYPASGRASMSFRHVAAFGNHLKEAGFVPTKVSQSSFHATHPDGTSIKVTQSMDKNTGDHNVRFSETTKKEELVEKGGIGSGRHSNGEPNYGSFLKPDPTTWDRFKNNAKAMATMPLATLRDKYKQSNDYLKQFHHSRSINPLHTGMYMLGLKEEKSMYINILKGKGPKGHSWKLVGGKRVYSGGAAPSAPVSAPVSAPATSSKSSFPKQTFQQVGEAFGGHKFTDNVMTHKDKASADSHEGFIHGHLTDAGYKHADTQSNGNLTQSTYEHPDGSVVKLNNGSLNGKPFVGYTHTPASSAPTSTADNMTHGVTPTKPDAHKVIQAYGDQKGYAAEKLKGGASVHTLRTTDKDEAIATAQNFHHRMTGQGFVHQDTTAHNGLNVHVSNYTHPNGAISQSVVTPNGHSFSVTPPKGGAATTPSTAPAVTPAAAPAKAALKDKDLKKIANLTNENFHGEAIAHGSKMLGRDDLHAEAKQINREHIQAGGLTADLSARRHAVYTKMMDHAKEHLSPSDYEKFHGSF